VTAARRTPSIRGLLKALLGVVVVLAVLLSVVTLLQVRTATKRSEAERQRVTSFRLSDGMRQSSNDLTRMVRLYVTTGDPRYRRYYDEILDIRSGDAPRPVDYDSSFWDRVLADGEGEVRRGPPAALTELMRRAHFSDDEFAALAASLEASNDLAQLELDMMNLVAPRIAAGADRAEYLREVAPQYARLVDDEYHAQKREIMEAIDRFTALVDARTARRAQSLQVQTNRLLAVQTAILILLAAVLAAGLLVAARAIVRPLSRLADVTRRITLGDWSQRAEPHGVAELTQLAGDFNEMADAIENDLAGRRIAEREAREAENRLQTIADRVPGAVFQFHVGHDGGFNVRFASRHGSIHRLARNEDVDFPGMARAVLPEDRGSWLDTMLQAARSGRAWGHEYRIHTPGGEIAWMQGQALTVKNADGSAELYGFVADVTDRKALEADLRRAREDAEAADRAKSAFLAMMSHELRTPLVAVTGTLEILALDALDDRQRELVDVAMGSARALLAVIGDVLDFSKIEAGFLDLAPVTVALGPLVEEVAGQHRHAARRRGLELTTTLDPRLGAAHVVDAGRLRQVLGNLLGNAMKFTREGGVAVDVTVLEDDGAPDVQRVALAVRDTGIGIAPEDQRRLFVPFTQASTDNARSSEGTGLGLAICRQLVEAMGGTVALDSTPGAGTTVTVELPLGLGAPADAEPGSDGAAAAGRRILPSRAEAEQEGSLVLLVEDHPVNRQVLAAQLEAIGFRVDTAADAAEALERFGAGRYGLVFTDIQLPHVDGYELARRLRDAERAGGWAGVTRTPLLALTASALQGERERCRAVGMDDVVTKPTTMAILASTLRRWLPHIAWPEPAPGTGPGAGHRALPPAVDSSALDELVAGDAELGARILASYAASIQGEVALLAEALEEGDRDALRRLAHQVAGASRAVGAGPAADAAERLEQAAGAGDGHEELADRLRDLRDALVAVMPVGR
jgi:signal transduction histidine kinase/CheY-like chemotaxis protein/HPt (histidine-containing phosphotransfer) domain-containing protein/HAMP domain-containing protein